MYIELIVWKESPGLASAVIINPIVESILELYHPSHYERYRGSPSLMRDMASFPDSMSMLPSEDDLWSCTAMVGGRWITVDESNSWHSK